MENYAICTPLEISLLASEVKGAKFKQDTVNVYGMLWGALQVYRGSQISKGVPESVLDNSWKPYHQEALVDQQRYFNKYYQYCADVALKFANRASGK